MKGNMFNSIWNVVLKRKWWIAIGVLVLAGAGYWFWQSRQPEKTFEVAKLERGNVERTLELSGAVRAKELATLRFPAGGRVVYLGAQRGEEVKKWQTIATIDRRELEKSLEKTLNQFDRQRLSWEQSQDDRADIHGDKRTDRLNEQDQATLDNSVLDVELQFLALQNTSIWAPFDGVLVNSPTNTTGTILSGADVFQIVNPSSLYYLAEVDEADLNLLRVGQEAIIELDAYPGLEIPTQLQKIAFESNQSAVGTVFALEFDLPIQSLEFEPRLGLNGTVRILLDKRVDVMRIPEEAVVRREGKSVVRVLEKNIPVDREIEVGLEGDGYYEVLSGLNESDLVIVQ